MRKNAKQTQAESGVPEPEPAAGKLALGLMATRIGFRLRLLQSLLGSRVVAAFAPYGLRPGAFTTMALIKANPGCSQVDLARDGGLDKSALVAIVDELEARGLARRGRSSEDRRRNTLSLTPEGETVMNEMYRVAYASEAPVREALGADLEHFEELVERAYQAVVRANEQG
ncbi:MAG TPA: MarR family winged helix-turn-helix transcriptional regulator [Sphingomonadaceae bacterium]|nr:MarR family winged helix-turn-helix transcriptional regulator [Sphingomonadaceae bacterium]